VSTFVSTFFLWYPNRQCNRQLPELTNAQAQSLAFVVLDDITFRLLGVVVGAALDSGTPTQATFSGSVERNPALFLTVSRGPRVTKHLRRLPHDVTERQVPRGAEGPAAGLVAGHLDHHALDHAWKRRSAVRRLVCKAFHDML
jgi:hypothetical protein